MNSTTLQEALREHHRYFTTYIGSLSEQEFLQARNNKWTPGQQADHIRRSVAPVLLAFTLPKFILKWRFGTANRPSRSYDELVAKYHAKLNAGGSASGRFLPPAIAYHQQPELTACINQLVQRLGRQLTHYSEADLDHYILPHPLLGKLTLREILYFTIYHVQHHHRLTEQNIQTQ